MIDSWRRDGVIAATAKHNTSFRSDGSITDLRDVIRGKLNYLRMVRREDDRLFRRYWNEARDADPVTFPALRMTKFRIFSMRLTPQRRN